MSRTSRMILVLLVVSLVAVSALAFLAWRYGQLASPQPAGSGSESAREAGAGGEATEGRLPEATEANLDAFVAARGAVTDLRRERPAAFDSLCDEITQDTRDRNEVRMHLDELILVRTSRNARLRGTGMTEAQYKAIREEYRRWVTADPALDPGWEALFDGAGSRMAEIDLGRCEGLDY